MMLHLKIKRKPERNRDRRLAAMQVVFVGKYAYDYCTGNNELDELMAEVFTIRNSVDNMVVDYIKKKIGELKNEITD